MPLDDVAIIYGYNSTRTDTKGFYKIGIERNHIPILIFSHPGYITSYKKINENIAPKIDVYLLKAKKIKNIKFNKKRTYKRKQFELIIPPNSLVDGNGSSVEKGDITYAILDPSSGNTGKAMPGRLAALDNGIEKKLESYGMFDISARYKNNRLYIKSGKKITIKIPYFGKKGSKKKSVPLWSFNTKMGLWEREGDAKLMKKKGKVWAEANLTHMSWWNLDRWVEPNQVTTIWINSVVDEKGKRVPKFILNAKGISYGGMEQKEFVNKFGPFCIEAKRNETVELEGLVLKKNYRFRGAKKIKTLDRASTCAQRDNNALFIKKLKLKKLTHFLPVADYKLAGTLCKMEDFDFPISTKKLLNGCDIENLTKIYLKSGQDYIGIFKQIPEHILIITKRGVMKFHASLIKKVKEL
jgi:hypothetical protein